MTKRVAVFCGSSQGLSPVYTQAAIEMAQALSASGIDLVYGGAKIGLMGALADEMLRLGREVIGVIPHKLMQKEVAHKGLTILHEVESMHERKALMANLADGFVAMPGGIGTLEEIIEVFTWQQIGYHEKPCALLNTSGFYDPLIQFLDHTVTEGFLPKKQRDQLIIDDTASSLIAKMSLK